MGRPSKQELKKREEAKELLKSTFGNLFDVADKNVVEMAEKLEEAKSTTPVAAGSSGNKWLEDQVTQLNEKNEQLENQLIQAKEDYKKLFESTNGGGSTTIAPASDSEVMAGVKKIFEEMRANYEGRNATRTRYAQANVKHLLDKFLSTFPALRPQGKSIVR